jgi:hypothetical protein
LKSVGQPLVVLMLKSKDVARSGGAQPPSPLTALIQIRNPYVPQVGAAGAW